MQDNEILVLEVNPRASTNRSLRIEVHRRLAGQGGGAVHGGNLALQTSRFDPRDRSAQTMQRQGERVSVCQISRVSIRYSGRR